MNKVNQICGILLDLTDDLAGSRKGTGVYDILRASSEEEMRLAVNKIVTLLEMTIVKLKEL